MFLQELKYKLINILIAYDNLGVFIVKIARYLAGTMVLFALHCQAQNEIRMVAPVSKPAAIWVEASPRVSDWSNTSDPLVCTTWNPNVTSVNEGVSFTQTAVDCLQNQERSIQAREQDKISLRYRNKGAPALEPRTLTVTATRNAFGTRPTSNWVDAPPLYSAWANTTAPLVCTTWAPDPATIGQGIQFQQTSNDCLQQQQSTVQAREQDTISLAYRNKGEPYTETKTVTVTSTRTATGTKPVVQGDYLVAAGNCCTGQHGYIPYSTGTIQSSSNPNYHLSYLVIKNDGTIYFAFTEVTAANAPAFVQRIKSVSIDFLDTNKNLILTTTANPPKVQFSVYMGWNVSGSTLTQGYAAPYMRLRIELNP